MKPFFPTFYVDDSSCEIGGKKHFILAAIAFESDDEILANWLGLKQQFGLHPSDEVKWNKKMPQEQRMAFVPLVGRGTGLVVIDDRTKQAAALQLCEQAWLYCQESEFSGFRFRFDRNIITDWDEFDRHARSYFPPCLGACEADSQREHLLQAADFLAGAVTSKIRFGLGEKDPNRKVAVSRETSSTFGLAEEECEIGWFLFASLRPCIWGKVLNGSQDWDAFKTTRGRGLSIHSSQDVGAIDRAAKHLDDFFMGCIH